MLPVLHICRIVQLHNAELHMNSIWLIFVKQHIDPQHTHICQRTIKQNPDFDFARMVRLKIISR